MLTGAFRLADQSTTAGLQYPERGLRIGDAERDVLALGIAAAAIIMFMGTGGAVLPQVVRSFSGLGDAPDVILVNALLLNIALILFGWRRYRQLKTEIEERRRAEERARILAETDPLTGCLNRRSLDNETARLLDQCAENGNVVVTMMIDLDNFKQINDFHGHGAGDEILQECARRIENLMPDQAVFARLGGDEFACAYPMQPERRDAMESLAASIVETVSETVRVNGTIVGISASVGVANSDMRSFSNEGETDAQTLLHMADIAMYHAKKQGRNCHFWFEEPMEEELRFRKEIEAGIRKGIPRGEFIPFYEKQINLETGELTGFEVLARWKSPELGLVSPDVFVPIAEEIGAIGELSESVIDQALEDARDWDPSLSLAVNISPVQLRDPWFAQKLLKTLLKANFPTERFEIEITESCLHENIGVVRTIVTSLKNQGIRVTLDDFGTGYSSLGQLRKLPFDRIKIDRSFVSNLMDSQDAETIVEGIALLGKGLGIPVTAEGIENPEVLEKLRQYENIQGQGYLYGKPESGSELAESLAADGLLSNDAEKPVKLAAEKKPSDTGADPAPDGPEPSDDRLASNG